jgi:hypothetical protein
MATDDQPKPISELLTVEQAQELAEKLSRLLAELVPATGAASPPVRGFEVWDQPDAMTEDRLRDIIREEVEDVFHAHGFDHSEDDLPPIH